MMWARGTVTTEQSWASPASGHDQGGRMEQFEHGPDADSPDLRSFGFAESERDAVYRAIYQRRDVRNFRPDPIPDDKLARIVRAAHHGPSVGFM